MSCISICPLSTKLYVGSQRSSLSTSPRAAIKGLKCSKVASTSRLAFTTRCIADPKKDDASRREMMLSTAGILAVSSMPVLPAMADDVELVSFYGAANPPATPGRVGGVTKDKARYTFDYPPTWKEEVVTKVEKGTNGTDVRLIGPARKKENMFVLTLLNFGGKKGFTMDQSPVPLLESLTGSLFFFQDALADGELSSRTVTKFGKKFFEYKLVGPDSYLVQVTVEEGRVFGFFLNANAKAFESDAELLQKMAQSFNTIANVAGADDRA